MKNLKNMKLKLLYSLFLVFLFLGCSELEEESLTELNRDQLNDPDTALIEALRNGLYSPLVPNFTERLFFNLQEASTDEVIVPTRSRANGGTDWFDGGRYVTLHTHTWTSEEVTLTSVFNNLQTGIATSLDVIDILSSAGTSTEVQNAVAEAQALLAFYSYCMFDLYSQIPYTDLDTSENVTLTGDAAITEIERLLTEAIPFLNDKAGSASGTRFSQAAAQMLLARLYLNKGVYADRYASSFTFSNADMQSVITQTTDIIDNGGYALANDYFALFDGDNEANAATDEIIFAADLQAGVSGNRAFIAMTLSQGMYGADNGSYRGWNGFATTPEFVNSWDTTDPRYFEENIPQQDGVIAPEDYELNRGIQVGVQYGAVPVDANDVPTEGGSFRKDGNGDIVIQVLRNFLRDNDIIDHTVNVSLQDTQEAGARVFKYGYDIPGPGRWDTNINIPLMRLADAYLMRAEAKLRTGDTAGALADINVVRDARGTTNLASVDLDGMLDERGFEFYWEQQRRTDLIRFGKFNDAYTEKPATESYLRVYPIPRNALAASSLLTQNQGYND